MISWVRDAEAQVQQRIPQAGYQTHTQKGAGQEGGDSDGGPVSAQTRNRIRPILRDLCQESEIQS